MHIVTLSFDDGLAKSSRITAEIYEKHGLSACLNVLATAHLKSFVPPGASHQFPAGDFDLWNELQARGHEIMPHGFKHACKASVSFEEARKLITDCLDVFTRELKGFQAGEAVFNFPYNKSTPELEAWLPTVVRAFRTRGEMVNPLPHPGQVKLTTNGYGPGNCEQNLDFEIDRLLKMPEGWLIYSAHGIDEEGYGPMSAEYLDRLLDRLCRLENVRILPAGRALAMAGAVGRTA